ncbi:41266_t:CDS:2, partial [Gigaspora margarita]
YQSEKQLQYFKKCSDHHKSWDSICNIYRHAISLELVWPYIAKENNPSVEGYLNWAKNQTNYHENDFHKKRTRLDFALESCKFRVYIRKNNFLDPSNNTFQNINSEWKLSEEIKKFSELVQMKRIEFIQKILIEKNSTRIWHPIPITTEKADIQKSENFLQKQEVLSIINSLLPYLNDIDHLKFKNLSSLSC